MEFLVLRSWRIILGALLLGLTATVIALGVGGRVGPTLGYELFAIRSGSMAPTIGVGALTIVDRSRTPRAGEVVTYRVPNGSAVTHRVTRVVKLDGKEWLETQGDANAHPDPSLIPADAVVGVVATRIAFVGYLLALLSMPSGIVTLVSAAGGLMVAQWMLEAAEHRAQERHGRRRTRRTRLPVPLAVTE